MNPEPTDRRDAEAQRADALDAFWDELVLDQLTGRIPRAASSANEEMVMNLRSLMSLEDEGAEARLRQLIFGSPGAAGNPGGAPEPALASGPARPMPISRPEPIRPTWSIRKYSQLAAAALAVMLVGALVAALAGGIFDNRGGNEGPTAIPAAVAQVDATPAALGTPTAANDSVLWTLPFEGTNVEIGGTALANGTLYRLIRSDQFTGVQAVDTATGTEKWRSAQQWSGNSIAAGADSVAFLTDNGVTALDPASGEFGWTTELPDIAPVSLLQRESAFWVWDGISTMVTLNASDGRIGSRASAELTVAPDASPASQSPVGTVNGAAAVSAAGTVVLFGATVNVTGMAGSFHPETIELAATPSGDVAIAGAPRLETDQPWARKLMLVDPADGSTLWETDYNALVTGLTVTDSMALILADNVGMAYSATEEGYQYPEKTSPQIYGYDLATGQMHISSEGDPSDYNWSGQSWVTDQGTSPYVALATGPTGPFAISDSGQLDFFSIESPLVQAVASLPGVLPNEVATDDTAVYASTNDGTVTAIAPELAGLEPQSLTPNGNLDWSLPPAGTLVDFGGMAYSEGLVYRLIDVGAGPHIEATFASTGQPSWTLPFDWSTAQIVADTGSTEYHPNAIRSGSGNIFAVDAGNRLFALAGTSGTVNWQIDFEQPVVSMLFDNGTLYVWDESGTMTALNSADGSILWATSSGSTGGTQVNELGMPIPVATGTVVAMVDAQGTLHGFDRTSGELLWSTPGFDGTNTRLVHQGLADAGQQEWFVALTAHGAPDANGNFEMVVSGMLAPTGERRWDDYAQGPLVQPVATDENKVFIVGNEAMTGKAVTPSDPIVDGESPNHYVWTGSGETAPVGGGQRIFAVDVDTGQIVWIRTTASGGFTSLSTTFPNSGSLAAVTTDGLLVSPSRGNGSIGGEPTQLGGPVLAILSSGETGAIGSFATLADGTLVAFGGIPFSQQG